MDTPLNPQDTTVTPRMEPRFTQHRISAAFPAMPEDQFRLLVEDIKRRGLDKPIKIYGDEVLDGWHRLRACLEAGVPPRIEEFTGTIEEATAYVVSANVRRRHLDTGQLALFTVEYLLPRFEAAAKERKRAGKKVKELSIPGCQGPGGGGKAAAKAAKITGSSPASVERAKVLKTHGTEAELEAVRSGREPLKTVAARVQARRTSPATTTTRTSAPKTSSTPPPVAQRSAPPPSASTQGIPIHEGLAPAWRDFATLLVRASTYFAAATVTSQRENFVREILEGIRRLYPRDERDTVTVLLQRHARDWKKIHKASWNRPARSI